MPSHRKDFFLISKATQQMADDVAKQLGIRRGSYIYLPNSLDSNSKDRRSVCLRGIQIGELYQLIGYFTDEEINHLLRAVDVSKLMKVVVSADSRANFPECMIQMFSTPVVGDHLVIRSSLALANYCVTRVEHRVFVVEEEADPESLPYCRVHGHVVGSVQFI